MLRVIVLSLQRKTIFDCLDNDETVIKSESQEGYVGKIYTHIEKTKALVLPSSCETPADIKQYIGPRSGHSRDLFPLRQRKRKNALYIGVVQPDAGYPRLISAWSVKPK